MENQFGVLLGIKEGEIDNNSGSIKGEILMETECNSLIFLNSYKRGLWEIIRLKELLMMLLKHWYQYRRYLLLRWMIEEGRVYVTLVMPNGVEDMCVLYLSCF